VSIGVASVKQKNLLLRGAVYYREQRCAAESALVVVGQVFSIGILAKCLTSASLEQYLIRNSRTVYDFSNSTIIFDIRNGTTTSAFRNSNYNIWFQE